MVNPFDKYMGEVVARQAQAAARIAANAVKNRPTPNPWSSGAGAVAQAVNRVLPNPFDAPSGGGGGWSGGASSVGQAVARAVVEQAAPPSPPTPTIGQRIASQIVENAGRVAQREAVPAAPVAAPRTTDGAPVFDWQPPQVRGLGETQGPPAPPEPRFFARPQGDIPDATDDLPAPDVTRQRPVEGPTLVAQDTGPRTASVQPLSAVVQQPARERTNEDVAVRGVRQTQATIGKSLAFADQEESPYVRVRSARTGQEYVVPRERAQNLGPGDEILGPADTQPESDRDRTAMGAEFLPTMRRTIGDLWSIVQYGGDQLINNPDTPIGRAVQNIRENGWGAVIPSYLDWADTGRVLNANNAIDAYIKLQMGDYDPSEEPVLLDAASLLTGALTTGAQAVLGNITITGSEEHGIETTGDVSFPEWHARTSVVVYEDGSTATVRNIDIENNPDKFENATVISNQDRAEAAYTE